MDKELALIIAEMLIKQDETTTQLKEVVTEVKDIVVYLNQLTDQGENLTAHVNTLNTSTQETNAILREFMGISVKQGGQQQIFNKKMSGLSNIERLLKAS